MKMVGDSFCEARVRSFYIDDMLVCSCLVLFFRLKICQWMSLTVGEGVAELSFLESEPKLLSLTDIGDDFAYPISGCNFLDVYFGREVLGVFEYRVKAAADVCIGVYFELEGGGVSVVEVDNCLSVVDGKDAELLEYAQLVSF